MGESESQQVLEREKLKWVNLTYDEWIERNATPENPISYEIEAFNNKYWVELGCYEITDKYVHPYVEVGRIGVSSWESLKSIFGGGFQLVYDWIVHDTSSKPLL